MPFLLLNRQCVIDELEPDSTVVVCEPRAGVSAGWCARIGRNPDATHGLWVRDYIQGVAEQFDGRTVNIFDNLLMGFYEAHSTLRARRAQVVYFLVTAEGGIEILGVQGDEDLVIAALNNMTIDELHDVRAASSDGGDLPPLEGTIKQVAWAARLRDDMILGTEADGDFELVPRLREVRDATWFIANRHRSPAELRGRLGTTA